MIANIGINCPQLKIDIYPYKFIKYVRANDLNKSPHSKEDESLIFFLVKHI